jgi:hypothetical protein
VMRCVCSSLMPQTSLTAYFSRCETLAAGVIDRGRRDAATGLLKNILQRQGGTASFR